MAICIAGFVRDMAGAMKLHSAEVVQYFRPEIVGFILGSFLISIATKEYKATAGSSPLIRFLLGVMMMIGALVFLLILSVTTTLFAVSESGPGIYGKVAVILCIIVLFIIACTQKRKTVK